MQFDSQDDEMTVFSAIRGTASYLGEVIVANPGSAGAVTAFCVAMTFFTANAVYFQDHQHPSALFATRPELLRLVPQSEVAKTDSKTRVAESEPNVSRFELQVAESRQSAHAEVPLSAPVPMRRPTIVAVEQTPKPVELAPGGDTGIAGIQELLTKLGYYDGDVDGLRGPKTDAAIEDYKNKAGLRGIELSDAQLVTSIKNNLDVTAAIPAPRPVAESAGEGETVAELIATGEEQSAPVPLPSQIPSAEVVKVQAALRAFGNTDVVVDGVSGAQTEAAIREFQALFHLPVTGEIDGILLDKMRAVGLIQ